MLDWVRSTIGHFAGRDDVQLVIRVHPAELTGSLRSRQPVAAEIARWYPALPGNVFVVGPDSGMSTYEILDHSDCAIRSAEHTSELQSLVRISYAVFCLKTKKI